MDITIFIVHWIESNAHCVVMQQSKETLDLVSNNVNPTLQRIVGSGVRIVTLKEIEYTMGRHGIT